MKKCLSVLLAIALLCGVLPMGALAMGADMPTASSVTAPIEVNPINGEVSIYVIPPTRYYGGGAAVDFSSLCTDDYDAIVASLRAGLEERDATVTLYYRSATPLGDDAARIAFMSSTLEAALTETDRSTQGDSLRYALGGGTAACEEQADQGVYYYRFTYDMTYYTSAEQEAELTAAVDALVEDFGFTPATTDAQKIATIYSYITATVTYDYENLHNDSHKLKHTAYAALINKTAVCQGYAVLFYRLARECGLDARVITGVSQGENHAWNIVRLGDRYYYVDSTWDAGMLEYAYFMKGTSDFDDHVAEDKYNDAAFTARYPIAATGRTDMPTGAELEVCGDFRYRAIVNYAMITEYNGTDENVVVPSTVNGLPVKKIYTTAFHRNNTIKTLTLSEGIEGLVDDEMTGDVIAYCEELTALHLPSTFTFNASYFTTYSDVPRDCPKLATVTVADGNPYITVTDGAVYSADGKKLYYMPSGNGVTSYTAPDGVDEIYPHAFSAHQTIESVDTGDDMIRIGWQAFMHCYELTQVTLSDVCTHIGQYVFSYCEKLESLHLPASLISIEDHAFYMATALTDITIDAENPYWSVDGGSIFCEFEQTTVLFRHLPNEGETAYAVPSGVDRISVGAFEHCQTLRSITLPDGLSEVESYAFDGCTALEQLIFPDSVTKIGGFVFSGCDRLVSVVIPAAAEMPLVTYEGGDTNGMMLQPACTIYGTQNDDPVEEEGYVRASEYAAAHGFTFKDVSEFVCAAGHALQQMLMNDNEDVTHRCVVCGCHTELVRVRELLPVLDEPQNLVGTLTAVDEITVTWDAVEGADAYSVYVGVGGGELEFYDRVTECSLVLSNLPRETYYYFRIKPTTRFLDVYFDAWALRDFQIMTAPVLQPSARFDVLAYDTTSVELFWNMVDNAHEYMVRYKKASDTEYTNSCLSVTNACTITGLDDNTTYDFMLIPRYVTGDGFVVECENPNTVQATTRPHVEQPTVTAEEVAGGIRITWSAVPTAIGSQIFFSTYEGVAWSQEISTWNYQDGAIVTHLHRNRQVGVTYRYFVRVFVEGGTYVDSDWSEAVTYTGSVRPTLSFIAITDWPFKTIYESGEPLDTTGMVVRAYYDDGSDEPITDYTLSGYSSTPGEKTVTVAYGGSMDVFTVTVVARADGWVLEGAKWAYYRGGAKVRSEWMADSIGWCYLGADGYMLTNEWVRDSVGWCYVGADGYCVTNTWKRDSIGWCYLDANGRMATNQWIKDSVGWCYVGADGYCVTSEWKRDSVGWCYLDANGRMATNQWVRDSIGWCYVGADGYAVTNCWKRDSVGWCYLNGNGSMTKNAWVLDGGKWYYCDADGYMLANTSYVWGGKTYYFNASGVCTNP